RFTALRCHISGIDAATVTRVAQLVRSSPYTIWQSREIDSVVPEKSGSNRCVSFFLSVVTPDFVYIA
ncbi:hypothetical protein B0T17DRAFT_655883, partial [Bombardia bombarda]